MFWPIPVTYSRKGDEMDMSKLPDWYVLAWYALAAVSGALGGCMASSISPFVRRSRSAPFLFAYGVLGCSSSVVALALAESYGLDLYYSTGDVILYSIVAGSLVPVIVFSHNLFSTIVLKYLGVEVTITMRRGEQERRK